MFAAAACAVLVALALAVARALKGPTVFDRVLAGNTVGTLAILLLAVVGFLTGRPEWLDIAITYGLLNVISTLAILKFFRHGDLAHDADEEAISRMGVDSRPEDRLAEELPQNLKKASLVFWRRGGSTSLVNVSIVPPWSWEATDLGGKFREAWIVCLTSRIEACHTRSGRRTRL
jgi:multicomponent Na+:H+ antiporter subunit F